eukprot:2377297-Rhodomonas_salina.1
MTHFTYFGRAVSTELGYAATKCHTRLCCYAKSSTELCYAATKSLVLSEAILPYHLCGTELGYAATETRARPQPEASPRVNYSAKLWYGSVGTNVRYGATSIHLTGTAAKELPMDEAVVLRGGAGMHARGPQDSVSPAMSLRACYAMSGTGIADAGICLRACYAGTDKAHGATCLHVRSAKPGTDVANGAAYHTTRVLRDVRY